MEKYHKEPPCLLPRPNHPHFPSLHCTRNYCVWVPCHPQPWSPREKQWTLTRSLISTGSQAGASRCAQHRALRFSPKRQDGWWERFSHNFYVSVCFMCGWRRIGDRGTLGSSGTAGTRTGLGSPPHLYPSSLRMVIQHRLLLCLIDWTTLLHGFLGQLSPLMVPFTIWALVALPSQTSVSGSVWVRQDGIADRRSSAEADAAVVHCRWVSHTPWLHRCVWWR